MNILHYNEVVECSGGDLLCMSWLLWLLWHMPRLHVAGDQVTTGSGMFSTFFNVLVTRYDSLYSQVLTGP